VVTAVFVLLQFINTRVIFRPSVNIGRYNILKSSLKYLASLCTGADRNPGSHTDTDTRRVAALFAAANACLTCANTCM
jgi:hypothetical protein